MWPSKVKVAALAASGRVCCLCKRYCGTNIELHHINPESDGGPSTLDNCIPLCFNCHADVGHYNDRQPKGTKYTASELRKQRDSHYKAMEGVGRLQDLQRLLTPALPTEVYEKQVLQFKGMLWRQTFPGPPNYDSFETDKLETYWLLFLTAPFRFNYASPEDGSLIPIDPVRVLHLVLTNEQYLEHREKVGKEVLATGNVWPSITGHHRGDALLDTQQLQLPV